MSSPNDAPQRRASQPAAGTTASEPAAAEPTASDGTTQSSAPSGHTELTTPSALPPLWRRVLAFVAILVGGLCGALIGYGFGDISCTSGSCTAATGSFTLLGAIVGAGGVAIVAILALRAMDEWESIGSQRTRPNSRKQTR